MSKLLPIDYGGLYIAQDGRCFYCAQPMLPRASKGGIQSKGWTRDHFEPKAKGHDLNGNVVLACRGCNSAKGKDKPSRAARRRFAALMEAYLVIVGRRSAGVP